MRIVIADDSEMILKRLQGMLSLVSKAEVVGVYHNGTVALAGLKKLNPDLAILDNKMPGLKGVEVIREIRKEDSRMKLMLLTFYADAYYRKQAMEAGADYFFSKVDEFEKVAEVVNEMLFEMEINIENK